MILKLSFSCLEINRANPVKKRWSKSTSSGFDENSLFMSFTSSSVVTLGFWRFWLSFEFLFLVSSSRSCEASVTSLLIFEICAVVKLIYDTQMLKIFSTINFTCCVKLLNSLRRKAKFHRKEKTDHLDSGWSNKIKCLRSHLSLEPSEKLFSTEPTSQKKDSSLQVHFKITITKQASFSFNHSVWCFHIKNGDISSSRFSFTTFLRCISSPRYTVVSKKKGTFICELILERYIYLHNTQKQLKITNYVRNKSFLEFYLDYNSVCLKLLGSLL